MRAALPSEKNVTDLANKIEQGAFRECNDPEFDHILIHTSYMYNNYECKLKGSSLIKSAQKFEFNRTTIIYARFQFRVPGKTEFTLSKFFVEIRSESYVRASRSFVRPLKRGTRSKKKRHSLGDIVILASLLTTTVSQLLPRTQHNKTFSIVSIEQAQ